MWLIITAAQAQQSILSRQQQPAYVHMLWTGLSSPMWAEHTAILPLAPTAMTGK